MMLAVLWILSPNKHDDIQAIMRSDGYQSRKTVTRILTTNVEFSKAEFNAAIVEGHAGQVEKARAHLFSAVASDPRLEYADPKTVDWTKEMTVNNLANFVDKNTDPISNLSRIFG
jgi:hypothetical protein